MKKFKHLNPKLKAHMSAATYVSTDAVSDNDPHNWNYLREQAILIFPQKDISALDGSGFIVHVLGRPAEKQIY